MPPSGSDQVQHTILIVEGVLACSDPTHAGFSIEPSKASTATRELDASISHGWLCMSALLFAMCKTRAKPAALMLGRCGHAESARSHDGGVGRPLVPASRACSSRWLRWTLSCAPTPPAPAHCRPFALSRSHSHAFLTSLAHTSAVLLTVLCVCCSPLLLERCAQACYRWPACVRRGAASAAAPRASRVTLSSQAVCEAGRSAFGPQIAFAQAGGSFQSPSKNSILDLRGGRPGGGTEWASARVCDACSVCGSRVSARFCTKIYQCTAVHVVHVHVVVVVGCQCARQKSVHMCMSPIRARIREQTSGTPVERIPVSARPPRRRAPAVSSSREARDSGDHDRRPCGFARRDICVNKQGQVPYSQLSTHVHAQLQ